MDTIVSTIADTAAIVTITPNLFNVILTSVTQAQFQHPIVSGLIHLHASLLLTLFNSLWLRQGTGNANFFYASTLVFGMGNGAALLDAVWSGLRVAIGELKEGYSGTATGTKAMVHDLNIRASPTQFCVDDDQTDGPVRYGTEYDQ